MNKYLNFLTLFLLLVSCAHKPLDLVSQAPFRGGNIGYIVYSVSKPHRVVKARDTMSLVESIWSVGLFGLGNDLPSFHGKCPRPIGVKSRLVMKDDARDITSVLETEFKAQVEGMGYQIQNLKPNAEVKLSELIDSAQRKELDLLIVIRYDPINLWTQGKESVSGAQWTRVSGLILLPTLDVFDVRLSKKVWEFDNSNEQDLLSRTACEAYDYRDCIATASKKTASLMVQSMSFLRKED